LTETIALKIKNSVPFLHKNDVYEKKIEKQGIDAFLHN
jgi:hypothetical protein